MGSCAAKEKPVKATNYSQFTPAVDLPDCVFLSRKARKLFKIQNRQLTFLALTLKLREDSAISFLPDNRILVGGGTNSTGCLTRSFALVDMRSWTVTTLPQMPALVKEGSFYEVAGQVYYVGGTTGPDNEEGFAGETPAPLMKYTWELQRWEVFRPSLGSSGVVPVQSVVQSPVTLGVPDVGLDTGDANELHGLLSPGSFLAENSVYLVGGIFVSHDGSRTPNRNVYRIDLTKDVPQLIIVKTGIEYTGLSPLCTLLPNGQALIAGGREVTSHSPQLGALTLNLASLTTTRVSDLPHPLQSNYPPLCREGRIWFIDCPVVLAFDGISWRVSDLSTAEATPALHRVNYETSAKSVECMEIIANPLVLDQSDVSVTCFVEEEKSIENLRKSHENEENPINKGKITREAPRPVSSTLHTPLKKFVTRRQISVPQPPRLTECSSALKAPGGIVRLSTTLERPARFSPDESPAESWRTCGEVVLSVLPEPRRGPAYHELDNASSSSSDRGV